MIDLHIHSNHSDGTDNIIDILKIAEIKKLNYISITDHNTCDAYYELKNIEVNKYYTGKILNGIEISTIVLGVPIEILAYNFDIDIMQEKIKKLYLSNEERNLLEINRLFDKAISSGININKNSLESYNPEIYASKFFYEIIKKDINNKKFIDDESWKNNNMFYRKYMSNPKTLFYIDTNDIVPNIKDIVKIIKDSGGLIFIPHIFEYRENSNDILNNLLTNYNIDGIECYYTTFSREQTDYLLNLCKTNNLYVSGGSDYHGEFKPNVFIGNGFSSLNIPDEIIKEWVK